ncbi:MAG: MFS transporter, partial [Chloroflexota bacterium]|nr:MFS transporter [Chloroflexota bacterium]
MSVLATYRRLLRNRPLTRLLAGEFVSSIGDWLYLVALLVVVYEESRSAVALGIIGAARILPYIVLSVPAGVVADRFDRRRILITTDIARGAVMVALAAIVALDGPLPVFVGLSILAACFSAFFGPAIGSLLPSLVTDEAELGPANSAWATLDNLATVVGPAVAGVLIAAGGLPLAFVLNAITFVVIASILYRLPRPARPPADAEEAPAASSAAASPPMRSFLEPLAGLALIDVVAAFVFGGLGILTVVIAADVLGDAQATTGYLNGALGLGGLVGAVVSGVLVVGRRLTLPLLAGGVVLGVCLALLGQVAALLPIMALMTVASAGSLLQEVVSTTIFQRTVPDAVRGRALGVLSTATIGAYAAGSFVVPILVTPLGLSLTLLLSGVTLVAATLAGVALLGRTASAAAPLDEAQARLLRVPV